jgi:hypothetical protein
MFGEVMKEMCDSCPFGSSKKQMHMRRSLRPGRFDGICQDVWQGAYFPCHKTTEFDDDGDFVRSQKQRQCKGALEFVARAAENRRERESRCR